MLTGQNFDGSRCNWLDRATHLAYSSRPLPGWPGISGEVSERLKEHAWKVCKRLNSVSRVRIPLSPPLTDC
jgi:hypothetical protein